MNIKPILIALLVTLSGYAQKSDLSNFNERELTLEMVKDKGNKLVLDDSITIEKKGIIRINLPYTGKNFQFVNKKKSSFGKIAKKAAGAVSSGAMAVGIGSSNIKTVNGAIQVANKADAVSYGADALEQIDDLPISNKAKKIAGKEMKVLKWKEEEGMHIITAKYKRKKYNINLEAAYVSKEIILE